MTIAEPLTVSGDGSPTVFAMSQPFPQAFLFRVTTVFEDGSTIVSRSIPMEGISVYFVRVRPHAVG